MPEARLPDVRVSRRQALALGGGVAGAAAVGGIGALVVFDSSRTIWQGCWNQPRARPRACRAGSGAPGGSSSTSFGRPRSSLQPRPAGDLLPSGVRERSVRGFLAAMIYATTRRERHTWGSLPAADLGGPCAGLAPG